MTRIRARKELAKIVAGIMSTGFEAMRDHALRRFPDGPR